MMIAKQVIDFQIDSQDCQALPFFEKTADSKRFLYFCRCFSPEPGGEFVVITEDFSGAFSLFVYLTGKLRFDTSDIMRYLESTLGPASEANAGDADAIINALSYYDGVSKAALDQQLLELEPAADIVGPMDRKVFESMISTANGVEIVGTRHSISTTVDRFVMYDGKKQLDFGSHDALKGGYDQLLSQIAIIIQQASKRSQV